MLRVAGQAGVMNLGHAGMLIQKARQRQRVGAVLGHAQRQRFSAHGDAVRGLGGQRAAHVAQALLLDLGQTPTGGRPLAVGVVDVGIVGPVVQARIRDGAAQRVAVAADVPRQRIHHQRCMHGGRAEHPRRRQGVIDDVDQVFLAADFTDDRQVGHLRARVGNRFSEDHARVGLDRGAHLLGVCCIDEGDFDTQLQQRAKQAVGVAEHKLAGHQMIAPTQQGRENGGQRRHAGGEADGALAAFHVVDLGFQRRGRGRALARIGKARLALEYRRQLARVVVGEFRRGMHRLVHRSVLDGLLAVGMEDRGGKAVLVHDGQTRKGKSYKVVGSDKVRLDAGARFRTGTRRWPR